MRRRPRPSRHLVALGLPALLLARGATRLLHGGLLAGRAPSGHHLAPVDPGPVRPPAQEGDRPTATVERMPAVAGPIPRSTCP